MKPKTMILMGLAVACGLGASYMTSRLLADRSPVESERVEILVAKRNLKVGEPLLKPEELFEVKSIAKDDLPPDAIKDLDALKGKIMKQSRNQGDHVSPANLRRNDEGLDIPEGYYAMGLRVNVEGSASGFATLPQSRVNIIHTVRTPDPTASYAQVLLENVLVLAADLKVNSEGDLASPAQVVTFALTQEEILKVNLAKDMGTLSLALRRLDDKGTAGPMEIGVKDIRAAKNGKAPAPVVADNKPPIEPKAKLNHYDIVNGSTDGIREVTRVYYHEDAAGEVVIDRTELVSSAVRRTANAPKQGATPLQEY